MLSWIDRLAWWWIDRRLSMSKQYGCWTYLADDATYKVIEKKPGSLPDPLDCMRTVGIKVINAQS